MQALMLVDALLILSICLVTLPTYSLVMCLGKQDKVIKYTLLPVEILTSGGRERSKPAVGRNLSLPTL